MWKNTQVTTKPYIDLNGRGWNWVFDLESLITNAGVCLCVRAHVPEPMSMCLLTDRWLCTEPVPMGHTLEFKMGIKSITSIPSKMLAADNFICSNQSGTSPIRLGLLQKKLRETKSIPSNGAHSEQIGWAGIGTLDKDLQLASLMLAEIF